MDSTNAPFMATPVQPVAPLSPEQMGQLASARAAAKSLKRGAGWARFEGGSIALFAVLTLACGWDSVAGLLMGAAMGAIAFFELREARGLSRLQVGSARRLGWIEVCFASLLFIYAAWSIIATMRGAGPFAEIEQKYGREVMDQLAAYKDTAKSLTALAYVALMGIAVFVQGGAAVYFFSREKHLKAFVEQTPPWILQMQQAGFSVLD